MDRRLLPLAALALLGCAPREADYPISERAQAAPRPELSPTARFDAPTAVGIEASQRLEDETAALAARAAALRLRGAALAATEVGAPEQEEETGVEP